MSNELKEAVRLALDAQLVAQKQFEAWQCDVVGRDLQELSLKADGSYDH